MKLNNIKKEVEGRRILNDYWELLINLQWMA